MICKCFGKTLDSMRAPFPKRNPLLVLLILPSTQRVCLCVCLPWLSALQHCCASRCSVLRCQFLRFSHLEKVSLQAKGGKWREDAETAATLLLHLLHRESCELLWRDYTVAATVRTAASTRQQFPPPHLWCVVLSNGDARAGCWWPRRGTRIHTKGGEKRHLITKEAQKVHQRTLYGPEKKIFSGFVSPLLLFALKLKWLKQLKDALTTGPLCPLRLQRCASSPRAHVCWLHLQCS